MINFTTFRKIALKAFVLSCFFLLLVPNLSLFNEKQNADLIRRENRKITAVPKFSPSTKKFYNDLEKCYQDRLFHRDRLIWFWRKLNFKGKVILKDNLFMGKHNWLFDKGASVKNFRDKEIKLQKLKEIQSFCQQNKVDFVFIAPPYKNAIYTDYMPSKYREGAPKYDRFENDMIALSQKYGVSYLSLYKPLLNARPKFSKPIYWSDDHHWSYEGASVGADEVLKYLNNRSEKLDYHGLMLDGTYRKATKEHSQINSLGLAVNGVTNRTLAPWSKTYTDKIYGVDQWSLKETQFATAKDPVSNAYLWGKIVNGEGIIVNKANKNNYTVLLLHDSYGSYMTTYLSQHVSRVINTHYRDKAGKKKNTDLKYLIKKYKPDAVVLQVSGPSFFGAEWKGLLGNIKY